MNLKDNLQFKIAQKMQSEHESLQQYPPLDVCYMLFKNFQYSKDKSNSESTSYKYATQTRDGKVAIAITLRYLRLCR